MSVRKITKQAGADLGQVQFGLGHGLKKFGLNNANGVMIGKILYYWLQKQDKSC